MGRVVVPEDKRLFLSNGDWLLVKKRLNAGEHKRMLKRGSRLITDGSMQADPIDGGTARILAYLIDWSFKGLDGNIIPIKTEADIEDAINSIHPDDYTEILRAIEAHEVAMGVERTEEKKLQAGETASSAPSTSPSDAAGGTATSTS